MDLRAAGGYLCRQLQLHHLVWLVIHDLSFLRLASGVDLCLGDVEIERIEHDLFCGQIQTNVDGLFACEFSLFDAGIERQLVVARNDSVWKTLREKGRSGE